MGFFKDNSDALRKNIERKPMLPAGCQYVLVIDKVSRAERTGSFVVEQTVETVLTDYDASEEDKAEAAELVGRKTANIINANDYQAENMANLFCSMLGVQYVGELPGGEKELDEALEAALSSKESLEARVKCHVFNAGKNGTFRAHRYYPAPAEKKTKAERPKTSRKSA